MTTAPINASECPAMYFVAECTTRSTPPFERLLQEGGREGVVDHDVRARPAWAAFVIAGMSATSIAGLVGDSIHTREASSQAATTASRSVMSTSRDCTRPRASRSASCITEPV